MKIEFTVPGLPVAQPRQRHRIVQAAGRAFTQNYTPQRDPVNAFKAAVKLAASQAYAGAPIGEPLRFCCTLIFPRPKSLVWKSRPMPRIPKPTKPDWDNLGKAICDALNGLLWRDDAQICDSRVLKFIASGDEQPRAIVMIEEIS